MKISKFRKFLNDVQNDGLSSTVYDRLSDIPYDLERKKKSKKKLQESALFHGDIVGIERPLGIIHYGIYAEDMDKVIHFNPRKGGSILDADIITSSIEDFLTFGFDLSVTKKSIFRLDLYAMQRDLYECRKHYSNSETVERAKKMLYGQFKQYNIFTNNCEHFAMWARFGVKTMFQKELKPYREYICKSS